MSNRSCELSGCSYPHYAKGKCAYHYSQQSNKTSKIVGRYKIPSRSAQCAVADCSENSMHCRIKDRLWLCRFHYQRAKNGVPLLGPRLRAAKYTSKCNVLSCTRDAKCKGMCQMHYNRSLNNTELALPVRMKAYRGAACQVATCLRVAQSNHMCNAHAARVRSGQPVAGKPLKRTYSGHICEYGGCTKKAASLGFCKSHYSILRKYGQNALYLVADYFVKGCPLCHRTAQEAGKPQVDHDHSCCVGQDTCGKCVRGAICTRCNSALGMLQDSLEVMKRAMRYVQGNHPAALLKEEA